MVDDLRASVTGLSDLLTRTVARVDAIAAAQYRAEQTAMESRLAAGSLTSLARQGGVEVPDAIEEGAPILSRLAQDERMSGYIPGRVDAFAGRANLLFDPAMEGVLTTTLGATFAPCGEEWEAMRAFTGAGTPSAYVERQAVREQSFSSSALIGFRMRWAAATGSAVTSEIQFQSYQGVSPAAESPWLVAAVRFRWEPADLIADSVTGTARLTIIDSGDIEVATSDAIVLEEGEGVMEVPLSCAVEAPTDVYRVRIIITYAASSIAGFQEFTAPDILELQMNASDTEDPPSFTPAIGGWVPPRIALVSNDPDLEPIITVIDANSAPVFSMFGDGSTIYGSGGGIYGGSCFGICLDADISTNNAATTVEWASFPVKDGHKYRIDLFIWYAVTSTAQGCQVGVSHPGGLAQGLVQTFGQGSPTGNVTETINSSGSAVVTTVTATDGTTGRHIRFQVNYTCAADGTFSLRFLRGGSSSAPGVTIRAGSGGTVVVSAP